MLKRSSFKSLFVLAAALLILAVAWQPALSGEPPGKDSVISQVDSGADIVLATDQKEYVSTGSTVVLTGGEIVFAKSDVNSIGTAPFIYVKDVSLAPDRILTAGKRTLKDKGFLAGKCSQCQSTDSVTASEGFEQQGRDILLC